MTTRRARYSISGMILFTQEPESAASIVYPTWTLPLVGACSQPVHHMKRLGVEGLGVVTTMLGKSEMHRNPNICSR